MNYRTDLAVETQEFLEKKEKKSGQRTTGYTRKQKKIDEDIAVTEIEIISEEGAAAFGKPMGHYITVEVDGILEGKEKIKERAARALAGELKELIPFHYYLRVLVVGLGNEKVTPDSLGPHTVDKVRITSHLFEIYDCDGDWEMGNVSGFNPSVTGVTGMETADVIRQMVDLVKPEAVVIIDALAARDVKRISSTIQICDTGISPGAGMGNRRREISEKTLGCRVVSIGVPTVIDSKTLILDAAAEIPGISEDAVAAYFAGRDLSMIVTSTDIDQIIKDFSDIIANGINITLHPGIYS